MKTVKLTAPLSAKSRLASSLNERLKKHERRRLKQKLKHFEDIEPLPDSVSVSPLYQSETGSVSLGSMATLKFTAKGS